jgi:glycerol-3-phosphate acyltransferase PlsY
MTLEQKLIGLIVISYFIGSIPFGLIVGLSKGIDPRTAGSGNIGATNVGRLLGGKFFAIVFTLDMLKSLAPMLIAGWLVRHALGDGRALISSAESEYQKFYTLWLCVGFAAFLGHLFPIFLKFKGGKGVSTATGILLGLWPYYTLPGMLAIVSFIVVFRITRYISVGSLTAAVAFPLAYLLFAFLFDWNPLGRQLPLLIFALLIGGMIVIKHKGNIARLRAGTENKFRSKTA